VSIGRPIANTQFYILDQHQQPLPVGVPGELYIGGAGIARSYLNRPELTAIAFIPNPFSVEAEARLYKTGDLVRYQPDGNVEYLGRIDHQVKVRGFRIELGEIQAVLSQHPAVRETVIVSREDEPGDKRIVAYVVLNSEYQDSVLVPQLRSYLQEKLPTYMVPGAFVMLSALPLTPNGKVDRRALPAPENARPNLESTFESPRTSYEEIIAGIWAKVLGLEQVSIHDNFFELGGHSLLATQVISRLRDTFQVDIPLRCLFESPTIAGCAKSIEKMMKTGQGLEEPPIQPVPRDINLPLSFAQERLWFIDQLEPGSPLYNIPSVVRLTGSLNVIALVQSLNEIVRRHEALRTTFTIVEEQPVQVIDPSLTLTIPIVDLQSLPPDAREIEARRIATEDSQLSFNFAQGLLV
ncbi:MAG: condensation domain-containing protein, partial [Microcystaceae cyanobacterium]